MTEVVKSSSGSSIEWSPTRHDELYQHTHLNPTQLIINTAPPSHHHHHHQHQHHHHHHHHHNNNNQYSPVSFDTISNPLDTNTRRGERKRRRRQVREEEEEEEEEEIVLNNLLGLVLSAFRRSVFGCSYCEVNNIKDKIISCGSSRMEIGLPTNVRHVAHVTFDRFNGFLGLPVEFEPEVPRRPPSASATVFGVSTNSMQLSFDIRGNSVPTILLLMQHRLYALGGLQAEGIFRINADNGQEEHVREQLNRGLVPDDVDVHCLAGLIKAWFRELPTAVLDCLSPEQVMQSQKEEECAQLARLLPPTEASLLDWAVNLMADVAQFEHLNKMNARNVAMVFAPNMTHMADPLTALMHAVQVMNFLKTLIEKTLKEREDSILDSALDFFSGDPSGGNGHHTSLQTILEETTEPDDEQDPDTNPVNPAPEDNVPTENIVPNEKDKSRLDNHQEDESTEGDENIKAKAKDSTIKNEAKSKVAKSSRTTKGLRKSKQKHMVQVTNKAAEKAKGSNLVSSVNSRTERIEAWR